MSILKNAECICNLIPNAWEKQNNYIYILIKSTEHICNFSVCIKKQFT